MIRHYTDNSGQTLDIIKTLYKNGINCLSVLIRHSKRFYSENPHQEPYMGLTDDGKALSYNFGTSLPGECPPKLYTSFMGRCIETAYLIDKGYTAEFNQRLDHPAICEPASPFYVKDVNRVVQRLQKGGDRQFLRDWFDGKIDEQVIDTPAGTADSLCRFMIGCLDESSGPGITICVSHDWNIYPVKEFKLGLPLETAGDVGYLEGVVFFKKKHQPHIMGIDGNAVPLKTG